MTARKKTRESKGDPGIFSKVDRSRFYREFKHDHGHGNENLKKKKGIGSFRNNNNSARVSHFLVHFLGVLCTTRT